MTSVSDLELPAFDYTDPAMRGANFHRAMAELRAQSWLATGPYGYVVLGREACEQFLRTREAIFPGMKIAEIFEVQEGALFEQMRRNILNVNGPDHTRLRGLVNTALSPRAVERYRPVARGFVKDLFDRMALSADGGETVSCEFVEAFAKPYPSQMIATVMGAPLADAPRLHHWSNWIQRQFDAVSMLEERPAIETAVEEFYEYAAALVEARRKSPGDDLISALIAAEEEGQRLSDVECINLVFNVLAGGVDTTQSQLAHAIRLLAEHPEQWRLLGEDPSLAGRAVEEVLRFEPITPFSARILSEELTVHDVTFPKDTIVMVCAFTANRDLEKTADWEHAKQTEDFDITADRARTRPLTFGAGVHYCMGANLARVELQEALAYLAPRMPDLELDGEPVYESITGIYGLAELPVRFSVA